MRGMTHVEQISTDRTNIHDYDIEPEEPESCDEIDDDADVMVMRIMMIVSHIFRNLMP